MVDGTYDRLGMRGVQRWTITIDATPSGPTGAYTETCTHNGSDQNAPLINRTVTWEVGGGC
jgi:hypothetical protein